MKLSNVNAADIPVIPVRNELAVTEVDVKALRATGIGLVSYGLNDGDTFEFPDSMDDVKIMQRQVRKNSSAVEVLVLGLKNGKPAWLSIANLRRRDHKMVPVHPVAEALHNAENDEIRLEMCLGKTIKADGMVAYDEAIFEDNVRTNDVRERKVAKLVFAA